MINWNFISCNIFIKKKIMMSYVLLLMLILYTINSEKLCKYEQNLKHKRSHLWLMRAVMVVSLQKTIHSPPKWVIIFYLSAITNSFPLFLNKTDCNIQRYRYLQDWRSSSNHFFDRSKPSKSQTARMMTSDSNFHIRRLLQFLLSYILMNINNNFLTLNYSQSVRSIH